MSTSHKHDYFDLLYIQNKTGMQTARSAGELGYRGDRWYFQKMNEEKKPFISSSYYSLSGNTPVVSIFYPIKKNDGEMKGFLGANIKLTALQKIVEEFSKSQDHAYVYLIDSEGKVVAHPDQKYVSQIYNYKTLTKTILTYDAKGAVKVDKDGNQVTEEKSIKVPDELQKITNAALRGEHGVAEYKDANGKEVISGYSPIKLTSGSDNWAVISVQEKASAMAMVNSMLYKNVIVTVLLIVVILFFILYTSKRLFHPVIEVTERIREVKEGDGDLTKRVETKAFFEIESLITYINGFIDNVHQSSEEQRILVIKFLNLWIIFHYKQNKLPKLPREVSCGLQNSVHNTEKVMHETAAGAKAIEQVTNGLQEISGLAVHVEKSTTETKDVSQQANHSFQQVTEQMTTIHHSVEKLVEVIRTLGNRSEKKFSKWLM